ncbi:MAG TPA: hypothetical protein VFV78_05310 [Vicinamibacterales bacterium]|nr:hypothetical protein [Vicinamibacterales bacterium]
MVATTVETQIRRFILLLLVFGLIALFGELIALGHDEDWKQFAPLTAILVTLAVIGWHAVSGTAASVMALRAVFVLLMVTGVTGIMLHYQSNVEFQLEVSPNLAGWALVQKALNAKAPPALAPGVMAQLGLLGLIYTYRHPALRGSPRSG